MAQFKTAKEYRSITEKKEGVTFHDQQTRNMKEDPENRNLHEAARMGKADAAEFLDKVRNFKHPDHDAALKKYQQQYDMSPENVEKACIDRMCNLLGAAPYEMKNPMYENKVFSKHRISNADDQGFMNKYKDLMTAKWDAVGYAGDEDITNEFFQMHPLSSMKQQ